MTAFDFFIALDGHGLNGFEGFAGVARLRVSADGGRFDTDVAFFDGIAGGHATQVNPTGTVGYLGNLSQQLVFYDPHTLQEIDRCSTLRWTTPDVGYSSQTHVVWLDERSFVTVMGDELVQLEMDRLDRPRPLGRHGVTLPHAMKRTPSGRYLVYGAMDHDHRGTARQVGIFDLQTGSPRVVSLPATAWHLGVAPDADVFYAPSQRCEPQAGGAFGEYTIEYAKNYLFEIDAVEGRVKRHLAIPKDMPGALTSDVVVTRDEVIYNCCASSVIAIANRKSFDRIEYIDERATLTQELRGMRAGIANLVEGLCRANPAQHAHTFLKTLRMTRMSLLDGSYGLGLSPDGKLLLAAHRGLNEVRVYDFATRQLLRTVPFPSIVEFFPEHLGPLSDPRLGFHHATLTAAVAT